MCGIRQLLLRKWFNTYESAEKNICAEKMCSQFTIRAVQAGCVH